MVPSVFQALQQFLGSRQTLDLSQMLKLSGRLVCSQLSDGAVFCLSWSAVCPSVSLAVQPVRAIPIIPTALLRTLMSINRPLQLASNQQRGWEHVTFVIFSMEPGQVLIVFVFPGFWPWTRPESCSFCWSLIPKPVPCHWLDCKSSVFFVHSG